MLNLDFFNLLVLVLNGRVYYFIFSLSDLYFILLVYQYDELLGFDNMFDMFRELYEILLFVMFLYVL